MLGWLIAGLFAFILIITILAVSPILWAVVNIVVGISGISPIVIALVALIPITMLALAGWAAVQNIFNGGN